MICWRLCGTIFFAYLRIFILVVFVDCTSIVSMRTSLAYWYEYSDTAMNALLLTRVRVAAKGGSSFCWLPRAKLSWPCASRQKSGVPRVTLLMTLRHRSLSS